MSFGGVFGEMSSTVLKASNHSLDRRQQEQLSSKSTTRLGSTFVKLKEEASSNNVGDRTRRHPPQGLDSSSSSSSSPYSSNMLLSAEFNKLKTDITESASRRGSAYSLPHQRAVSNPLAFESGSMTENAVISNLLNPENWSIRKTIMKSIEMLTEANFTTNKSSADTITKGPQPTITQLRGQPPSSLLFKKSSGDLIGSQGGGGGGSSSSVLNVDSTNAFSLTSKTSLSPSHQSGKLSFSAGNRLSSTSTEDRYSSSTSPRGPSVFVSSDSRRQSVQPNIDILSVNDSSPEELSPRRPSVYVGGEAHRQSQFNPLLSPQSTSNSRRRSSTFPGLGANSTSSRYELDMNTLSLRASALLVEPEAGKKSLKERLD